MTDERMTLIRGGQPGSFLIARCAVSNVEFAQFVDATAHRTDAELFGWSFVFGGLLPDDFPPTRAAAAVPWWRQVEGADWRHPEGPQSDIEGRENHPVVHVSWDDAHRYCAWAESRLPTEAEWELAARGGLEGSEFPWGDELEPDGRHRMNVWQGTFPVENTLADGYYGTCPVDAFEPNGYELHNMTGNVWEWCADSPPADAPPADGSAERTSRGGSYLCHASYCRRYTVTGRNPLALDSSVGNVGFRCARDAAH